MTAGAFEFNHGTCASPGRRRRQEDYSAVWQPDPDTLTPLLVVLADGMGGHASGHLASELACQSYIEAFTKGTDDIGPRMVEALEIANRAIAETVAGNPEYQGMGCTIIGAYLDQEGLRWVSVGDSTLMLYRNGSLRRLNADHSHGAVLDRQAAEGIITHEEAMSDSRRRALHSALTGDPIRLRDLELNAHQLFPGDWIIVASDGLLTLEGNDIAKALHQHNGDSAEFVADHLVTAVTAMDKPGQDNTTVVAVKIGGDVPEGAHLQPDSVPRSEPSTTPRPIVDDTEIGPPRNRPRFKRP